MTIALDPNGSSKASVSNFTGTSTTLTISTTNANDVIILDLLDGSGDSAAVVTSTSLTWTQHAIVNPVGNTLERWFAIAASPLSGEVITVSGLSTVVTDISVYAISGANTVTPFDAGGPVTSTTGPDPFSITTVNPNTMVIAQMLEGVVNPPTAGSGWTQIHSLFFYITEFQVRSTAGTVSVTLGTGAGDASGAVIDAIVQASAPTPPLFLPSRRIFARR